MQLSFEIRLATSVKETAICGGGRVVTLGDDCGVLAATVTVKTSHGDGGNGYGSDGSSSHGDDGDSHGDGSNGSDGDDGIGDGDGDGGGCGD